MDHQKRQEKRNRRRAVLKDSMKSILTFLKFFHLCFQNVTFVSACKKASMTGENVSMKTLEAKFEQPLKATAKQTLAGTHYAKIHPPTWAPAPSYP